MPGIFDKKIFNTEVFNKYTERVPNLRKNELSTKGLFPVPVIEKIPFNIDKIVSWSTSSQ